jgi:hypothetical protein
MRIWSEVPRQRNRELAADVATAGWIVLWISIGVRLFNAIAEFSETGAQMAETGSGIQDAGSSLGAALEGLPLVGEGAADLVEGAFTGVGDPLIEAGAGLEQMLVTLAIVLAVIVVAVALVPWLNRYIPWRLLSWRRLNAGDRAIHGRPATAAGGTTDAPAVSDADMERVLASRAMHRLEFAELLEFTPDPIGDFVSGRYDRLAEAELASQGLRK